MNMDEKIMRRNGNGSMRCGISVWLKEINLLEYSMKFIENGYDDLDQFRTMRAEDLAELSNDVGLTAKKGHLKPFYAAIKQWKIIQTINERKDKRDIKKHDKKSACVRAEE